MISIITSLLLLVPYFQGTELISSRGNFNNNNSEVVANVGNINITKEEFFLNYEFGPSFTKKNKNSKEKHLKYMLYEKLFALEGSSIGLDTTRQVKNYLNSIYSDLATEAFYEDEIISKVKITDEEIDSVIVSKSIYVKIKWLFSKSKIEINSIYSKLESGIPFDTLFYQHYITKVEVDDKKLETTRYLLGKKNPELGKIVDTLESKNFAKPIFVNDGWYIIYLDSFYQNPILTETELLRLKTEATNAIKKNKLDSISDRYVEKIMIENEPIIKSTPFRILRSYLSNYILEKELYHNWSLSKKMKEALSELGDPDETDINNLTLVELKSSKISISQFLKWFWLRDQYIKFDKNSLEAFSISLRDVVFKMVRDNQLTEIAKEKGYFELESVKKQYSWWKEKILSGAYKNYFKNSIILSPEEIKIIKDDKKYGTVNYEKEYTAKLFRKIQNLKKKYLININEDVLNSINVSVEENPKAINFYTVKKGGLIPRTPYPTIDGDWANWE